MSRFRRLPPKEVLAQLAILLHELAQVVPPKWGKVLIALAGLTTALILWLYHPALQPQPELATMLTHAGDYNLLVYPDGAQVQALHYRDGRAALPTWTSATIPALPGVVQPTAKRMDWDVDRIMGPVGRKERPLRYCDSPIAGSPFRDTAVQALREVFGPPYFLPAERDCAQYDVLLTDTAAQDCRSANAVGCAWYRGTYVQVGYNPAYPLDVRAAVWHEAKHAGDLAHTGPYGGEAAHPDRSDLTYLCPNHNPCGNPDGREPAWEDWLNPAGGFWWGIDPQRPGPSASPSPTASPSPSPAPTCTVGLAVYRVEGRAFKLVATLDIPVAPGPNVYGVIEWRDGQPQVVAGWPPICQ